MAPLRAIKLAKELPILILLIVACGMQNCVQLKWSIFLLKVSKIADLDNLLQMFSQVSLIFDIEGKFLSKKCGLYVGVYGMFCDLTLDQTGDLCSGMNLRGQ